MQELIKITEQDGKKTTSARELYRELGYDKSQFSRWAKKNILENAFAIEGEDYVGVDIYVEGSLYQDFALSLDFAKKLCMLSKTKAGEKIRDYFIECEKQLKQIVVQSYSLPQNYEEALVALLQEHRGAKELQAKVDELTPKAEYCDKALKSVSLLTTSQIAQGLGMTAQQLNKRLHELGVIFKRGKQWFLYSKYQGNDYVDIKTFVHENEERVKTFHNMQWTEKGKQFIYGLLSIC